ncbi:hypothetical protein [Nitrospira calida]
MAFIFAIGAGTCLAGCSGQLPASVPAVVQNTAVGQRASEVPSSQKSKSEAPATPAVIEAEEFRLLDREGKVRGLLRVDDAGASSLILYDSKGKARAILRVPKDGPSSLSFLDEHGNAPTTRHSLP